VNISGGISWESDGQSCCLQFSIVHLSFSRLERRTINVKSAEKHELVVHQQLSLMSSFSSQDKSSRNSRFLLNVLNFQSVSMKHSGCAFKCFLPAADQRYISISHQFSSPNVNRQEKAEGRSEKQLRINFLAFELNRRERARAENAFIGGVPIIVTIDPF
jgi:hypothetical protein